MLWLLNSKSVCKDPEKQAFRALVRVIFKGEERTGGAAFGRSKRARTALRRGSSGLGPSLGGSAPTIATPAQASPAPVPASKNRSVVALVVSIIAFVMLAVMFLFFGLSLASSGVPLRSIFLTAMILMIALNILTGIFSGVNYLYYPKDLPFYLSLPYAPRQIIRAKFLHFFILTFSGSLIFLPMVLGPFFIYGSSILTFLAVIIAYIAGAASMDLVLVCLTIILMRFTTFARNKDRFMSVMSIVMMFIGIGIAIAAQFVTRGGRMDGGVEVARSMGSLPIGALIALGPISPPILLSGLLFSQSPWLVILGALLSLAGTTLHLLLMSWLSDRFYLAGVLAVQGAGGKRSSKRFTLNELQDRLRPRKSMGRAYSFILWKKLRRVPIFFSQMILAPLMIPLMFIVIGVIATLVNLTRNDSMGLDGIKSFLAGFGQLGLNDPTSIYILLVVIGIMAFNGMGSALPMKLAVSTDGQDFFFFKTLPQGMKHYLYGIQRTMIPLSILPNLILLLIVMLIIGLSPLLILIILVNAVLLNYTLCMIYLVIGAVLPSFEWENENTLLKGNPRAVLWVYSGVLFAAILAIPQVIFPIISVTTGLLSGGVAMLLGIILALAIAVGLTLIYYGPAARRLSQFES